MKTIPTILLLILLLPGCSRPKAEEEHFDDATALRQSSLFKKGQAPAAFVDILPPSVRDIHYRYNTADSISHMKFRLVKLPDDYFTLISRMEMALESEVERIRPFNPGASWWDARMVRHGFDNGAFVFRKLPLGVGNAVYTATSEAGVVYVWMDQ